MGTPLHLQILERPVTSILITLCTSVWAWLNHRHLGYQDVGLSHDLVIHNRQFWRIVTSQLSHVDYIHLLFNMTSLWSLGGFEQGGQNSIVVLQQSPWLLVGSGLICLAIYHAAVYFFHKEHYRHVTAVGYSAVIFGWMALLSARGISNFSIFGMVQLPMSLAPFGALVITSVIIPQASFIGHLSGILMGYLMAYVLYGLTVNLWCSLALLALLTAGCVYSLREHISVPTAFHVPNIHLPNFARPTLPDADIESGADVALLSSQQGSHQ
ncbi:MAG: rhomboid 2-like protein [Trebouxia sp. A1-2]|nr:MAG: rhomboid 2-like protein [Trebouxia sp. A1-2]